MLAISRALVANPRLLVMDEPTEGLAPLIVAQVEEMLVRLAEDGEMAVLVIEQNIGVACAVSENVAIMVNGRINRVIEAPRLAADRALQQRLLGVGRHGHDDTPLVEVTPDTTAAPARPPSRAGTRIYVSNPTLPTRWSQPVPVARIEAAARTSAASVVSLDEAATRRAEIRPLAASGPPVVVVAGTLDTKGEELRFIRDLMKQAGLRTRLVDLSTSGKHSAADVAPLQVALHHPRGSAGVFTGDRGVRSPPWRAFRLSRARAASPDHLGRRLGRDRAGDARDAAPPRRRAEVMISTVASGGSPVTSARPTS
jgi:ABC-type glutathione transport system ATPase component